LEGVNPDESGNRADTSARRDLRLTRAALGRLRDLPSGPAATFIAATLAMSWGLGMVVGGASKVAPHWFYIPVLFAAARFGRRGALTTGVLAGLLAGPALPAITATDTPQEPVDWLSRAFFFVVIGQIVALVIEATRVDLVRAVTQLRREKQLRIAHTRNEFVLHYQPVVSLTSGSIEGVEALVRWQHPERGLIYPVDFIADAEDTGFIVDLGATVLWQGTTQLRSWHQDGYRRRVDLAINVSVHQITAGTLPHLIDAVLAKTRVEPQRLHLEVTETALVEDLDATAQALAEIRARGVRIALDDFGVGHSSLAYLERFPVDTVKIDQSFVRDVGRTARSHELTAAVVALAHQIGIRTIAEGVETAEQANALRAMGCELAQGFYFSRPVPADELSELLRYDAPFVRHVEATQTARARLVPSRLRP
jgi:EAL domain-containing protein (putative c-di-GMP-specific phosphodiesterase class I)